MNHQQATQALNYGKHVRRSKWPAKESIFIERHNRKSYLMSRSLHNIEVEIAPHVFYWDDVTANDWSVVEAAMA